MQKKFKNTALLIIASMIISVLGGCAVQTTATASTVKVKTAIADKHKIESTLNIQGLLVPAKISNVLSKIPGQITSMKGEVGSSVNAGQVLIRLETMAVDAQLKQAQAGLQSAEAALEGVENQAALVKINLDAVQKSYNDTKLLYESGAVSKTQFDEIANKLDTLKKQYENAIGPTKNQAQAAINTANANIGSINVQGINSVIKSPISGIIVNKNVNVGEIASVGSPLMTIADTSSLKLKSTVSQEVIPFLAQGQEIDVSIDIYPDKKVKGKIESIGPISVSTGMIFPIEISIDNVDNIKAGLSASALVNITVEESIVVPTTAVVQNNGENYVFIIKDNIAIKCIVTLGLKNDKEIQILKGLNAGEQVAATNVNNIFDNMPVDVK